MLLEWLLSYFDPSFLAFTLVMGYLWFFLFFFRTKQWDYLEWPERFFFGFMIGLVAMFAFILIDFPVMVLLSSIYAEQFIPTLLYLTPIVFSVFLLWIRVTLEVPLSSKKAKNQFLMFLTRHKAYWLYLLPIFSIVTYVGFGHRNVFLLDSSRSLFADFLITINVSSFYAVLIISFLVTQLSCLPFKSARLKGLAKVFKFIFPLLNAKNDVHSKRKIKGNRQVRRRFLQSSASLLKSDFLHKAILVALLGVFLAFADIAFHLATPAIQIVETEYEPHYIEIFKDFGGPVFYNIEVTKTYWIRLPQFSVRNLNLSIPNPSNFSIFDGSKYLYSWKTPYAINIEADSALFYTVKENQDGEVESINIMPKKGATGNNSFIKLTYNDHLNVDLMKIGEINEKILGNGSILVTMTLIANNTESRRLRSSDFPLFSVERYGNLTSFEVFENGIKKPSPWKIIENQWLWTYFGVYSNTYMNFTVSAIFEEATL